MFAINTPQMLIFSKQKQNKKINIAKPKQRGKNKIK